MSSDCLNGDDKFDAFVGDFVQQELLNPTQTGK
jgi:hypothetical protein